jgi:UTP:GlnB (protein PII) uridylyltransferase
MISEMKSRHMDQKSMKVPEINVKEGIGGLRDIEMMLLIYKDKYGLREPVNRKLMNVLGEIDKRYGKEFGTLADAFDFLKNVRDIYRLTVSAGDVLRPVFLDRTARILGYSRSENGTPTEQLLSAYHECTSKVTGIVEKMLADSGQ